MKAQLLSPAVCHHSTHSFVYAASVQYGFLLNMLSFSPSHAQANSR